MSDIKAGDVVQLKSGGPKMTVKDIGDYSLTGGGEVGALCVWFDAKKTLSEAFPVETLEKISD